MNRTQLELSPPRRALPDRAPVFRALPWLIAGGLVAAALFLPVADAATLYWDANSTTAGSGLPTPPSGTWGTSNFWNSDPTGGAAGAFTTTTTSTDTAFFNAGNYYDVTAPGGTQAITISGSQSIGTVFINSFFNSSTQPTVTISGGTQLTIATGNIYNGSGNSGTPQFNTISTPIAGGNGLTLTGQRPNGLALTAANSYTGTTTAYEGTLKLDFSAAGAPTNNIIQASSPLVLGGGATLNVTGKASTANSQTFASLALGSGTELGATAIAVSPGASGTAGLTFTSGAITRSAGDTLNFNLSAGSTVTLSGASTTHGILGGWTTAGGGDWASLNGSSQVVGLSTLGLPVASGGYDSATSWTAGHNMDVPSGGYTVSAGATAYSMRFANGSPTLTLSGTTGSPDTITSGGILISGSAAPTIIGGVLQGAAGQDLVILQNSSGAAVINSTIQDNGSATGLTKSGTGTLTLGGTNTYSGATTVEGGQLNFGSFANLGTGSVINLAANSAGAPTLDYTGGTTSTTRNINISGGDAVIANTGSGTLTLNGNIASTDNSWIAFNNSTAPIIVTGQISLGAGVVRVNPGTSTVAFTNNTNNFNNAINIYSGTLQVSSLGNAGVASALGATGQVMLGNANNATLEYTGSTAQSSNKNFYLNGSSGATATIKSDAVGSANALTLTGNFSTENAAPDTLQFAGTGDISLSGKISGTQALTMSGTGTLTLSGSNSYTGATTIASGTLSTGSVVVSGGTSGLGNATSAVTIGNSSTAGTLNYTGNSAAFTRGFSMGAAGGAINTTTSGQTLTIGTGNITGSGHVTFGGAGNTSVTSAIQIGANNVAYAGTGTLTLSGSNTYTGTTSIQSGTLSTGNVVVSGGISGLGNATSAVALGTASTAGTLAYTGNSAVYTRGFTVAAGGGGIDTTTSGQTLTIGTGNITGSGNLTFGGAGNTTVSSAIQTGAGGVTYAGSGILNLSGTNTYSGATTVNSGTLLVNGSLASGSAVTVNPGGTIGGNGTIGGTLNIATGGTLSPGNSPGLLTAGATTWSTGGNYNWQMLNATGAAGTGFDQLAVIGTLNVLPGFHFNMWSLASIGPDVNGNAANFADNSFQEWIVATTTGGLINAGNLSSANIFVAANNGTGGFSNALALNGHFALVQGGGSNIGTANDVDLVYFPTPEPSSFALMLLAPAGLWWVARRWKLGGRRA